MYRSTPGATVVGIAGDLGIMDSTLSGWLKDAGCRCIRAPGGARRRRRTVRRRPLSWPGCAPGWPSWRPPSGS
ncbi:hypothetical protein [Geodermatophilus africanus]|uniref:hypothetical protein n=1 Tax=Geodermatophilus africanus TaxID=1137993 RepID=UPI001FCDF262|nr:hypothetical protein [Geodermatophilus africanus]